MEPTDLEDPEDQPLRAAFQNAPFPPMPRLEPQVHERLRRRRAIRRGGLWGGALAAAIATIVLWQQFRSNDRQIAVVQQPAAVEAADADWLELAELQVLFSSPPVDLLDQLAQQQAAVVAVVHQVVQE